MVKLSCVYLLLLSVACDSYQRSPCPSIFQYKYDKTKWIGVIRIPPSDFGASIKLLLTMALEAELPNPNYVGHIVLADENQDVENTISNGDVIKYYVLFPVPTPIPIITSLLVNNIEYCSGAPVVATSSAPFVTTLRINHDLLLNIHQNNAPPIQQSAPSFLSSAPLTRIRNNPLESSVDCGIVGSITNALIIGGEETQPGEWPWLSALYHVYKRGSVKFICSGSLVSKNLIITAAHCMVTTNKKKREILIKLGIFNVFNWTEPYQRLVQIEETIIHPNYDTKFQHNDIALLKIPSIEYSQFIKPICIWSGDQNLREVVGVKATVVGWGKDENDNGVVPEPKKAKATIVSTNQCIREVPNLITFITEKTLCAGNRDGTGPCNGDSGGGLYVWRNNHWVLRGIVSNSLVGPSGETCNNLDYVLYTDVAKYLDWISENII